MAHGATSSSGTSKKLRRRNKAASDRAGPTPSHPCTKAGAGIEAVNQLDRSDDAASQHIVPVRHRHDALRAVQQCLDELVAGHACGCMHQKAAAKIGVPTSVFYIFAAMDN